jgi:hypothetical protein
MCPPAFDVMRRSGVLDLFGHIKWTVIGMSYLVYLLMEDDALSAIFRKAARTTTFPLP